MPARWLALIAGRLKSVEAQLLSRRSANKDVLAQSLLTELNDCYRALQLLHAADSSQVAYFVVRSLRRWFTATDRTNEYLFTSGVNFETELLQSERPVEFFHKDHAAAIDDLPEVIYRVTMPGGALGAALHIPLVGHEVGHILFQAVDDDPELEDIVEMAADMSAAFQGYWRSWIAEVFSDTICGYVVGPAGFFALHEKLRGVDLPNKVYPHNAARVASLRAFIEERFGQQFAALEQPPSTWTAWPTRTESELRENCSEHGKFSKMSRRLLKALPLVRKAAVDLARRRIPKLEYMPTRFARDLGTYVDPLLYGIPPFESCGDLLARKSTNLATILNVGWFVAAFRLNDLFQMPGMPPADPGQRTEGRKLAKLDELIFKAIELSEAKREWGSP